MDAAGFFMSEVFINIYSRVHLFLRLATCDNMCMKAQDLALYDSLEGNTIPSKQERSIMRRWFESAITGARVNPAPYVKGGLSTFRKTTEAISTGAALAAIHVETNGGLDKFGYPLDGIGGALLAIGSTFWPNTEVSNDARDIGADALTVYSFRKTTDFLVERRMNNGKSIPQHLSPAHRLTRDEKSNVAGEDPIVNAAKAL